MRLRDAAIVIALSVVAAAIGAYVAELVLASWSYRYVPAPGSYRVLGVHTLTAWLAGGLVPGFLASLVLTSRFAVERWVRILAGCGGLACLGLVLASVVTRELPIENLVALGFGLVAATVVVLRRRSPRPTRGVRAIVISSAVVGALALGVPTLLETYAEYRSQDLRPFTLEIVAAYPAPDLARIQPGELPAYVVDSHGSPGERVEHGGRSFFVHRDDRVTIPAARVRRVRWLDSEDRASISIRVDQDTARIMRARSERRISQFDALYIDGVLVAIPLYEGVVSDRIAITDGEDVVVRRIYDLLVRGGG
ncbi:MAG: hypothetical protein JNL83_30065 [Myxococcales bacterium]|nr:hypothetical protein [Myxococcales bacterium]